jgi:hypothetical protein
VKFVGAAETSGVDTGPTAWIAFSAGGVAADGLPVKTPLETKIETGLEHPYE